MTRAIILAGGLGTRLRQVVSDVPKPMAPINGKPFLAHQMMHWKRAGIDGFVLSIGYLGEMVIDYFGDSYLGLPISYAVENTPLGTGGGLLLAIEKLDSDEPFLLLNGDTYFDVDLGQLLELHSQSDAGVTFALFRANEPDRFGGVRMTAEGRITEFRSGKAEVGQLANGGVYLIDPLVIKQVFHAAGNNISFEEDILPELFKAEIPFFGLQSHGKFVDIGVPRDFACASNIMFEQTGDT
ncbi:sugar phosphate nucleotidyltransferase [Cohaesibacter celericrescens]|uniref:Phosphohexose mutase n=1 Tax=Cohaesibacter celericrescens TaxID=2067669 RepID=A0A2N5XRX4_9HYPH|nr:sugar phosphate nucleotidyltransferase [Cohaesibacter celericrescens]PLW77249.1 phosphohexose mutase [Cohaesibacter celericrescens]